MGQDRRGNGASPSSSYWPHLPCLSVFRKNDCNLSPCPCMSEESHTTLPNHAQRWRSNDQQLSEITGQSAFPREEPRLMEANPRDQTGVQRLLRCWESRWQAHHGGAQRSRLSRGLFFHSAPQAGIYFCVYHGLYFPPAKHGLHLVVVSPHLLMRNSDAKVLFLYSSPPDSLSTLSC